MEDQEKELEDAKKVVKEHAYFMNKELENANLRNGLKHAASLLGELRTSKLAPRNYYILFMAVFDEMRELEKYFKEEFRRGRKMVELYAAVQHAPQLIPRLYLLITVGSVFIQSHEDGSHKILEDLMEALKAVQNPLRGLFIRYYFLKMCKDRLPDTGSEYESPGCGIEQAVQIIYNNLRESVTLWTRLNVGKDKSRKEKDRNDLKVLIGEGLQRLTSLDGVHLQIYKTVVLPKLLEMIRANKDALAQQYLLDCMIQGFPEEFHINTLPEVLELCANELEKQVDVKQIFISLMERLADYATTAVEVTETIKERVNLYDLFKKNIDTLIEHSDSSDFKNVLYLETAFLKFTIRCYPTQAEYVNEILKSAVRSCSLHTSSMDEECQSFIVKILTLPLDSLSVAVLTMHEYPNLMKYLKFTRRREVAQQIVKVVAKNDLQLTDEVLVGQLLIFIEPLLKKLPDSEDISEVLFKDQQANVARLVFQINSEDPSVVWGILKNFIEKFREGGPERIRFTYPSTIFKLLQLARHIKTSNPDSQPKVFKKIFELCRSLITELSQSQPRISIKLYLQFLQMINELDRSKAYDEFTYEAACDCLLLYESHITEPETKLQYLHIIIGTLQTIDCMSAENYDTLITNVVGFCSKILKKNEQCEILLKCTHLFHSRAVVSHWLNQNDQSKVFEVLKKCAKLANTCVGQSVRNLYLFVPIMNAYAYFGLAYSYTPEELQTVLNVFLEKYAEFEKEADVAAYVAYWHRTKQYLQLKAEEGKLEVAF